MNKTEIKLKEAAEDIKDILRKHDIAAAVVLHAPGHGEYFFHLNTSYSCAYHYEENMIRFYSKLKDFESVEQQRKKSEDTSNMLKILTDCTAFNFSSIHMLSKNFDEATDAIHS